MAVKRAKSSFAAFTKRGPRMIRTGELVDAKDPVIKGREALFEDVQNYVDRVADQRIDVAMPMVEQATAEPGEKRDLTAPAEPETQSVKRGPGRPRKTQPKEDS